MTERRTIQSLLTMLSTTFSSTSIQLLEDMFGKKCEVHMPWEIVEQLQGQFDRILTMGSGNTEFTALTCAGIQYDSLNTLVGQDEIDTVMAADVLGEFVNQYNGAINDNSEFNDQFGVLIQGLPMLYTDGQSFLPFIWGIHGYVYFDTDSWLYVGFSIRNVTQHGNSTPRTFFEFHK